MSEYLNRDVRARGCLDMHWAVGGHGGDKRLLVVRRLEDESTVEIQVGL